MGHMGRLRGLSLMNLGMESASWERALGAEAAILAGGAWDPLWVRAVTEEVTVAANAASSIHQADINTL